MSSESLSARLQALADTYKQTLVLIQQLTKLPTNTSEINPRADLASEIHESLKEQTDKLELLRQEADDSHYTSTSGRWVGGGSITRRRDSEREQEYERNIATIARLGEDLSAARGALRRAQLQAKRNADAAKRKERELLFANRGGDAEAHIPGRRKGLEKLTQDELALNASNDVTAALRRTHDLLQGNLQQSQFALQTLDESSAALSSLGESYGGVGDLLKGSKGLVGQLLRSQKSDTWYLETAFFILCVTIGWLVFRRLLYGPLWWFAWQPLKLVWWFLGTVLSSIGITGGTQKSGMLVQSPVPQSAGLNAKGIPTFQPGRPARSIVVGGKGGGWNRPSPPPKLEDDDMVEKIGRMAEKVKDNLDHGETNVDDISQEEREWQEEQPRNPKKRMMEQEKEEATARDEL